MRSSPTGGVTPGQGGGWLGAHATHVIDQIRVTMGEIEAVSATLSTLSPLDMTADDTYSVQLRLAGGANVLLHGSCAMPGQFVVATKVVGTSGAAWLQGEEVWVDDGSGPRAVPVPDDLPPAPPSPPPAELLHTTYDMWHSMGIDLDPYTRLYAHRCAIASAACRCRLIHPCRRSPTASPTRPSSTPSERRRPPAPGATSSTDVRAEG